MRALITNDDGVESPGIRTLAVTAAELGLEVLVAAPSWDSSGASASLTSVEQDGRFMVREHRIDGLDGVSYGIEAAPAFITRAAVHEAFGPPPDVVLSGINRGYNCGHAVLHSGTVGAASTAHTFGLPAVAFSVDATEDTRWDTAQLVVRSVLEWFARERPRVLLNVNVPGVGPEQLRGLRQAQLAAFGAVTANVTEAGRGYVAMEYRAVEAEGEPGTDVALLAEGYATFTALSPVCEAHTPGAEVLSELLPAGA